MVKKICLIAQFPPPIHGLSKAVDTLYRSELSKEYEFEKINITDNRRILTSLNAIRKSKADLFYFTISQSRGVNLRDLIILLTIGKRPCIIHLHGGNFRNLLDSFPKWQKKANIKAIGRLSGAIVLGNSLRYIFRGILPEKKIITLPNCVDDEYLMSDREFDEKINSLQNRKVKHILYLSNFIRSKGYPEVLKLARIEKENGSEKKYHFDFAGRFFEKKEERAFWKYIKDNQLEDYVSYHGVVEGDKKRDLLRKCDYFVLLTRYPIEGQPISILEAMGNGMAVITTDHAGIPDIVTNGKNGIVVSKDKINVAKIYRQLQKLELKRVVSENRSKILHNYRQTDYINNFRTIFEDFNGKTPV